MPLLSVFRRAFALVALFSLTSLALAQPDLSRTMGETLLQTGSQFYRFEQFDLSSADQQRHYRVYLATPKQAAPAGGYPALYMLDGNAALKALQDDWLKDIAALPVLVMIGHPDSRLFNVEQRVYDYTIKPAGVAELNDEQNRAAGGAAEFLQLINTQIKPEVTKRVAVNNQRLALWGHSFGGLFTLNTLLTSPDSFQRYFPVSPSLWWQSGLVLSLEPALAQDARAQVWFSRGSAEGQPRKMANSAGNDGTKKEISKADKARIAARNKQRSSVPPNALIDLVAKLDARPNINAEFREFEGLSHGETLATSLPQALAAAGAP